MGYETSAATQLVATACVFCGRPLVDADSVQLGIGPICAQKYGVFGEGKGPADWDAFAKRLETAPDPVKRAVDRAAPGDAHDILNHLLYPAGTWWENNLPGRQVVLASVAELAQALGYHKVADKLIARYITGTDHGSPAGVTGFGITAYQERGDTWWTFSLPKRLYSRFRDFARAVNGAGGKFDAKYHVHFHYRSESDWIRMLNVLVADFAGTVGTLPNGEVFVVPTEPLPIPGPPGDADEAPDPDSGIHERPQLAVDPATLKQGLEVLRSDGSTAYVRWFGQKNGEWRVGLASTMSQRGGYEFVGIGEIRTKAPSAVDRDSVRDQLQGSDPEPPPAKRVSKRELPLGMFEHQREGALWLDSAGSGVLAFEPGLGKTLAALAVTDAPAVVICPNNLKFNWVSETVHWRPDLSVVAVGAGSLMSKKELEKRGYTIKSERDRREATIAEQMKADVLVINYEQLQKKDRVKQLIDRNNRTLIIDESHRIKELRIGAKKTDQGWVRSPWKSSPITAAGTWEVAMATPRRFLLTGTPMPNGLHAELFGQLHTVAPEESPFRTFKEYAQRFCPPVKQHVGHGQYVDVYDQNEDGDVLRSLITGRLMVIKRQAECLDLPPISRQTKYIPLSEELAKEYRSAVEDFLAYINAKGGQKAMDAAARAEAIVKMTKLHTLSGIGKAPAFAEEVAKHVAGTGRPVVVMAHHKQAAQVLVEYLEKVHEDADLGLRRPLAVGVYGWGTDVKEMHRVKTMFQSGLPESAPPEEREYLDVIVCSIMAAKEGITLTRANDMFLLERVFTPASVMQAEKRIHRISQDKPVTYYYFEGSGTIDAEIADVLISKIKRIEEFMRDEAVSADEAEALVLGDRRDVAGAVLEKLLATLGEPGYESNPHGDEDLGWTDPDSA
jgi:hypothetical protein